MQKANSILPPTNRNIILWENTLGTNQIRWIHSSVRFLEEIHKLLKVEKSKIEDPKEIWMKRIKKILEKGSSGIQKRTEVVVNDIFRENLALKHVLLSLAEDKYFKSDYVNSLEPPAPQDGDLVDLDALFDSLPLEHRLLIREEADRYQREFGHDILCFIEISELYYQDQTPSGGLQVHKKEEYSTESKHVYEETEFKNKIGENKSSQKTFFFGLKFISDISYQISNLFATISKTKKSHHDSPLGRQSEEDTKLLKKTQ